jgi:outer membrane protein TolC
MEQLMKWLCWILVTMALVAEARANADERALSLADALSLAEQRSGALRAAEIEVTRAKLQVLQRQLARVSLRIDLAASGSYQQQVPLGNDSPCATAPDQCQSAGAQGSLTAALRVPVWTGFTVEANLAGAHAHERSSEASRRSALRSLQVDVAQAYWELRRKELAHAATKQLLGAFRQFEQITQKRVNAGLAPLVDYNRARAASIGATTQVMTLERDLAVAHAQLGAVLQLDEPIRLTDDPMNYTTVLPSLEEAEHEALQARPELVVTDADHEAARQAVRAAKGAYWPQLTLVGDAQVTATQNAYPATQYGDQSGDGSGGVPNGPWYFGGSASTQSAQQSASQTNGPLPAANGTNGLTSYDVGAQLQWNIFDMLNTWLSVRDAALTRDRAWSEHQRRHFDVIADVRKAHAQLRETLRVQEPVKERAALTRADLELLRKRYEVGSGQLLEVLDAQQKLLQGEVDVIDRAVDLAEADMQLKAAVGRF